MKSKIAISSGKGGTGKTFISTNIARSLEKSGKAVHYIDCDVEAPNGHLFLKPEITKHEDLSIPSPIGVDEEKCTKCKKCEEACHYNAIAIVSEKVLFFQDLCHTCGACTIVCPTGAVIEKDRKIGEVIHGKSGNIGFHYALLKTGEGGMAPRLVKNLKKYASDGINIFDTSPGTACPVVEAVIHADLTVLVTDPTPFGVNDLKLSVDMCRAVEQEPVILINRADYMDDNLKRYCKEEGLEIIGEVPDDRRIAECYSEGNLAVEKLPEYQSLFSDIALNMINRAQEDRHVRQKAVSQVKSKKENLEYEKETRSKKARTSELIVVSGKGGTGKTSIAASFCALDKKLAIADCDVDAADLHLILQPEIKNRGLFSGGDNAWIDTKKCTGCGECFRQCRFEAIRKSSHNGKDVYSIDQMACEGCGVCCIVCPEKAVNCEPAINGEWYTSTTRFGPMSHAKLGVAEENSGRLVTLVKNKKDELAAKDNLHNSLIDGSPGTGCPVIASITGADYALIVTEPTVSGIHDLKRILDVTSFFKVKSGIIVNKYDINTKKTDEIRSVAEETGASFLGTLPYDKRVTEAQVRGLSVIEYTNEGISQRIKELWNFVKKECFGTNGENG